jgi:hypothetical protein
MLRDGSLAQFRLQVRENKCVAKLLESAKITEVEPNSSRRSAKPEPEKKAKKTSTKAAKKKQPKKRKATAKPR